jgi:hypothetical protein
LADSSIKWAGRTLHGTDRFGKWVTKRDEFDGWWDSPEIKGETADRSSADGEYDMPTYNEARLVTVSGHLHSPNAAVQQEAMHFLSGPMSGRLQVELNGSTLWADAKRNSAVNFNPVTGKLLQWQVRLKCPDPRKFGDTNKFTITPGQTVTVFHYGNYAATPIVTVTGDFPSGYTLWGPGGKTYVVTVALAAGTTHTIDMAHGLLRTNQYYFTGGVGDADVWTVAPGQASTIGLSAPSGSGTAVASIIDTFI